LGQGTISLDPNTAYQTMIGWEAVAQAGQIQEINTASGKSNVNPAFAKYKDQLYDQAVSDLGINRLRVELRSGSENPVDYFSNYLSGQIGFKDFLQHWYEIVNDNDDPHVINPNGFHFTELDVEVEDVVLPMRQRLAARKEKLYVNLCYVDFQPSAFEHKFFPEEYAEFVLAAFIHLRDKYSFVPDGLEMILEPDTDADWSATQIGNAIVAAGNRLRANGFNPEITAPSTTSLPNAIPYFDQMVQIPGVTQFLSELSYHRYAGASDSDLTAVANRAVQYNINTAHLELIGATYNDLHQDLTLGRNSSWQQFTLAQPSDGSDDVGGTYYLVNQQNTDGPTLSLGSRTKFLRQYFKFIRSGALRIKASSSTDNFEPVAFVNTDGTFVVVVKTYAGGDMAIQGLPGGTYGVKYTTPDQYDVNATDVSISPGQAVNASIPDQGVITIYGKTTPGSTTVDAASYVRAATPGQIVAAFGVGFPNGVNVSAIAGNAPLPTKLGSVSVRVNGTLAPLFFVWVQGAGAFQVNYQLPYQTQPGLAYVEVLNNDAPVASEYLIVGAAAPGVFTITASGKGQAVAINQDFSLNGDPSQLPSAKPESRGRVVTIFANGAGGQFVNPGNGQSLTPTSGTAVPANPIYATAVTPIVTVGGVPATVAFSGLTPGLVGVWQLNIMIPPNAPVGNAVPVVIKMNRRVTNLTTVAVN